MSAILDLPFDPNPPTEPGAYLIVCGETDFDPSEVVVYMREGELWVNCPDVGEYPVDVYHSNLIDCAWRKKEGEQA